MSAAGELRDMDKACERCGAAPRVARSRFIASVGDLRFAFPCEDSREDVIATLQAAREMLVEMYAEERAIARWAEDGGQS